MAAPAFDTLRFQQKLAEVLEPRTATVIAEAFGEATTSLVSNSAFQSEMTSLRAEIRSANSELRAEMRGIAADTLKWAFASQVVLVGVLFAAIRLL